MVFVTDRARRPTAASSHWLSDLVLLWLGTCVLLVAVILWFDNAQGGLTGNGIFKSMEMKPWIADPRSATLNASNYLYYPVYGALCRLLDGLGIYAGDPRRQMTILNALSASFCICVVYAMVRRLTGDRLLAFIASAFHVASSFVLFLAITNEDIMPSYTVLFASMALAAVWFARPTPLRIVIVSVIFSIGWLFEWRLMFPTLPAMLAALWLCTPSWRDRIVFGTVFLAGMLGTATVASLAGHGHSGAAGPIELIWTGKAVGSAWAGFSWQKALNTIDGTVAYLLGTGVTNYPPFFGWDLWRVLGMLAIVAIAVVSVPMLWWRRSDNGVRAVAVVFGGTFVAGLVFNLYSQPQDPQMQINIMGWLTVGWMLVAIAACGRWGVRGLAAAGAAPLVLFAYNIWSLAPLRGLDGAWQRSVAHIGQDAPPARTVFVINDFDWFMVYASLHWGQAEPGVATLGSAPQEKPVFKWIGVGSDLLRHSDWTVEQHVAGLQAQIDRAFELGYDVLISQQWELDGPGLAATIGTLSNQSHAGAIWRMLHARYRADKAFDDVLGGRFYHLRRNP
jgi:hypothetical protein